MILSPFTPFYKGIDLFGNSICSLKQQFLAPLPSIFSAISSDMFSKINGKVVEKLSIFLSKASFRRGLIFFLFYFVPLFARIDVVIPVHKKDAPTLDVVINAIEKNVEDLGIIYTISDKRYSDRAEWIDEKDFPFSIEDVGKQLGVGDNFRCGWYFQQLLKFYAHKQIEGLTDSILILDADTKPNHKMKFMDDQGKIYLDTVPCRCMLRSYYVHMDKLFLDMKDIDYNVNPVNHHAVFSKKIIEDMFFKVESSFNLPFWKVFLNKVDSKNPTRKLHFYAGASEYMIYYHFCKNYHKDKVIDRTIKLFELAKDLYSSYPESEFDFISSHKYKL